jgi:hypothetical protein
METPLEFLLLADKDFEKLARKNHYESGNRWRPQEYRDLFNRTGCQIQQEWINQRADEAYLEQFIDRLRNQKNIRYKSWPEEDLALIGVFFLVKKLPC